jgi:16S rRNA (cytidine1402-2'-O)-methyltransferase
MRGARANIDKAKTYTLHEQTVDAAPLSAGLHLVATPIGNLRDITLRALETLAAADVIACEDTRVTRKLLDHYGITTPLTPYHEHNAAAARPKLLERLAAGQAVALVSDAGTPLVSDPGYKLVRATQEAGHAVTAAPGASAALAALTLAGLPTDRFFFEGFLPAKDGQRQARIAVLARVPATLILFETGPRLPRTLAALATALGPREAAVCRELTKLHEEVRRGLLSELRAHYEIAGPPKGEVTLIVSPPHEVEADTARIDSALERAMDFMPLRAAVDLVADLLDVPRRGVYERALAKKDNG